MGKKVKRVEQQRKALENQSILSCKHSELASRLQVLHVNDILSCKHSELASRLQVLHVNDVMQTF